MKSLIVLSEAERELRVAISYYEDKFVGLGAEFRREFEHAVSRISVNPFAYAIEDDIAVR